MTILPAAPPLAHGLQPGDAAFELGRLGIHALQHQPDLAAALAAQALELVHLLGQVAPLVGNAARRHQAHALDDGVDVVLQHLALARQQQGQALPVPERRWWRPIFDNRC